MKIKSLALLGAITISIIPVAALADITVTNLTKSPATASLESGACSGSVPPGVIKPGQTLVVKDWIIKQFCKNGCKANLYMDKNCHSKIVATAEVNPTEGVKNIHNTGVDGYHVEGGGKYVTLQGGPARKWYQLFF